MFNTLKQARAALSMLNPAEVRRLADRPVHFGLVASSEESYRAMEDFLAPANERQLQLHRANGHNAPEKVDVVLYEEGVVDPDGGYTFDARDTNSWIDAILRDHDDLAIALANQFPAAFRARVVGRTIHEIARENAIFALATAM